MKKTFKTEYLKGFELPYDAYDGASIIEDTVKGKARWSVIHEIVFTLPDQEPGTAWRGKYSVGATEYQDERAWEFEDTVECTLVHQVEKVIKVWEEV